MKKNNNRQSCRHGEPGEAGAAGHDVYLDACRGLWADGSRCTDSLLARHPVLRHTDTRTMLRLRRRQERADVMRHAVVATACLCLCLFVGHAEAHALTPNAMNTYASSRTHAFCTADTIIKAL